MTKAKNTKLNALLAQMEVLSKEIEKAKAKPKTRLVQLHAEVTKDGLSAPIKHTMTSVLIDIPVGGHITIVGKEYFARNWQKAAHNMNTRFNRHLTTNTGPNGIVIMRAA